MLIGAGTVLDPEGAFAAINAGAEFLGDTNCQSGSVKSCQSLWQTGLAVS